MGDNITNQDLVARSVMERGGTALKKEIVSDTGLTPAQVGHARDELIKRRLFNVETLRPKGSNVFTGFRLTIIDSDRVKVRINKLLNKFNQNDM